MTNYSTVTKTARIANILGPIFRLLRSKSDDLKMTSEKEDFDSELTSEVLRKITKEKLKQLHYSKYIAYKIHARLLLLEIILSF